MCILALGGERNIVCDYSNHTIIARNAIYVFACLDNVYETQPA